MSGSTSSKSRSKETIITEFASKVMQTVNLFDKLCTNENQKTYADRLKKRIALARSADESVIIYEAGPFLYKYRVPIMKREESFFLTTDLVEENKDKLDSSDADLAEKLVKMIKGIYEKLPAKKREELIDTVNDMLTDYLELLQIEKSKK